jgi:membrane protein implicated in regulation of membrane protease activity
LATYELSLMHILGPILGLLIVGVIIYILGEVFTKGPTWLQLTVVVLILLALSYAIVDGIIHYEDKPYYADEYPADGNGGRYD